MKEISNLSEQEKSALERNRNSHIPRWYVMTLPLNHYGGTRRLQQELDARTRKEEDIFEYFAPIYIKEENTSAGKKQAHLPLLYNYVFIHASESEILKIKKRVPEYSFLPRIKDTKNSHYPYITDQTMENLRWVAAAYSNQIPAFTPNLSYLSKGDKVRITNGAFKGVEATIIKSPGTREKEIVVCVDDWIWVPLLHVESGAYEVISLAEDNEKQLYSRLDSDRLIHGLHQALRNHYTTTGVTAQDRNLAEEAVRNFQNLSATTDVMRCKLYSTLLIAYTVLGNKEKAKEAESTIKSLFPLTKSQQSKALLSATLYACTDNAIYHSHAHDIIDQWAKEEKPKKNKQLLIDHLRDYDQWLNH